MTKLLPWKVALFDVDGTLLDSNDAHARAWVHVLAGSISLNSHQMNRGDAAAISSLEQLTVKSSDQSASEVLLFDLA